MNILTEEQKKEIISSLIKELGQKEYDSMVETCYDVVYDSRLKMPDESYEVFRTALLVQANSELKGNDNIKLGLALFDIALDLYLQRNPLGYSNITFNC